MIDDFQKGVVVVSEQQMVTASGVLGAGLGHMQEYTVFDFQIVIYLSWMETNMHLSTLSILRTWFWHRPRLRAFKLLNMLALLVMMCIAIYPTTEYDWAGHTMYDLGFCPNSHSCWGLTETVECSSLWCTVEVKGRTNFYITTGTKKINTGRVEELVEYY